MTSEKEGHSGAFEIALQKKNYGVAECILRDLTLKDAIKKGVNPFFDFAKPKRRNSF